jgi:tetratricopeptide (TPR) repeat protein
MNKSKPLLTLGVLALTTWGALLLFPLNALPVEWAQAEVRRHAQDGVVQVSALRTLLIWQPWRADLWLDLARAEQSLGEDEAVAYALERSAALMPLRFEDQLLLAQVYSRLGRTQQALQVLQQAATMPRLTGAELARLAQAQRALGDFDGLVVTVAHWQTAAAEDAQALYWGALLATVRDPQAAAGLWPQLVDEPAYAQRAAVMQAALEQVLTNPDPAYRLVGVGRSLGSLGEWDMAAWAFEQAVSISPQYAEAWAMLAQAQQALGRDGGAAVQQALELQPDSVLVQASAASYWLQTGQVEKALSTWQALAERQPLVCLWWAEQGRAYAQQGDLIQALAFYQQAVQIQPTDADCWQRLALFSLSYGMDLSEVGLPAARQVVALRPNDPQALSLMGQMLMAQGDFVNAERFLRRSLGVGETAQAHFYLGELLLRRSGPSEEARLHLQAAAERQPGSVISRLAQQLLTENFR